MKIFNMSFEKTHSRVMGTMRGFASRMVKPKRTELENMSKKLIFYLLGSD